MFRKGLIIVLALLIVISTQSGVVAANREDADRYPEEIQDLDCPDISTAVESESVEIMDVKDCTMEDGKRFLQRTVWSTVDGQRGLATWAINKGESLQQSSYPFVPAIGQWLEDVGQDTLVAIESRKKQIATI